MVYNLKHSTTYDYANAVSLSHHLVRLSPREHARQKCVSYRLEVDPVPRAVRTHTDYFGNHVSYVAVEGSHKRLTITSFCQVEVTASEAPDQHAEMPWEIARDFPSISAGDDADLAREFVFPSTQIKPLPEFKSYALPSFQSGRPLRAAVMDLTARIHREFKFDSKATTVATPLELVMKTRRGVCQDFAHLEIAFLRAVGIPARYVSGYLETDPPPGKARLAGADASHAWVSFFAPTIGWIDVDPTNNLLPGDRHITIGWGRDFHDVSPIRGVLLGSGEHSLKVAVDVIPASEPRLAL